MMTSDDKVGGWVKKGQNHDDVILEWFLTMFGQYVRPVCDQEQDYDSAHTVFNNYHRMGAIAQLPLSSGVRWGSVEGLLGIKDYSTISLI